MKSRALGSLLAFFSVVSVAYSQSAVDHVKIHNAVLRGESCSLDTTSIQETIQVDAGHPFTISIYRSAGSGPAEFRLRKPDLSWVYGGTHAGASLTMGTFSAPGDYWAYIDGNVYPFTISHISTGEMQRECLRRLRR